MTATCRAIVEVVNQLARAVNHQPRMNIDVPFRVPFKLLWDAGERFYFGKELRGRAEPGEPLETDGRAPRVEQQFFHLAPDAFGREVCEVNRAAEFDGRRVDVELEARGELRGAQHAQRIFDERFA